MPLLHDLRLRARALKAETLALTFAVRDPRVPWYARLLAVAVVAYALSPIDLIPDVIPILGYLDDVILVPMGIVLVLRMIPPEVMAESRVRARAELANGRPVSRAGAIAVVVIWVLSAALLGWLIYRAFWT